MFKKFISLIVIVLMCFSLLGMKIQRVVNTYEQNVTAVNLDTYMTELQKEQNFHGSVLVAKDGKILLEKGYGMADIENKIKNSKDTRFAIGSVTKQFTAMAIMQLFEKGKLALNDKLSKYIPDFKNGDKITLHNLLTHSSGIYNYTSLLEFSSMKPENMTLMNVINLFKNKALNFSPGTKFEYSNSGYVLLTYIIEKVSGLSYDKYLDKNIFKPLGMINTGDCYQNNELALKTIGYSGYLETEPVNDIILKGAFGAGELYSTTGDLYKWDRALYTEKLLKKANIKRMFTEYQKMSPIYSYGYGFMKDYSQYGYEILHTGGTLSFSSIISRYVDKNVTVIALVNSASYDTIPLKEDLADIVFGIRHDIPKAPKEVEIDKSVYKNYAGRYTLAIGSDVEVTTDGEHLFAQISGQEKIEILPESEVKFFSKKVNADISFELDKNNKVIGFTLFQSGNYIKAVKNTEEVSKENSIPVEQSILDSYAGIYDMGKGATITVTSDNGHLYAQLTGQDKFEIFSQTETKFYYKVVIAEIDFNKNADGIVDSLTLKQSGLELNATKTK
jgi:CubicO group peptidase (beta-lactamase class C family)